MKYVCNVILTEKFCETIEADSEDDAYNIVYDKYKTSQNEIHHLEVISEEDFKC